MFWIFHALLHHFSQVTTSSNKFTSYVYISVKVSSTISPTSPTNVVRISPTSPTNVVRISLYNMCLRAKYQLWLLT